MPIESPGEKQCRKGRIWCYLGDDANPYVVYDYTPNRKRDGPATWLGGYSGYLQADAYGGYDGIYHAGGVTEVACWANARKFYDAQDSDGRRAARDARADRRALCDRVRGEGGVRRDLERVGARRAARGSSHCAPSGPCRC